ncbi:MAG TPA: hypothetical protein VIO35_04840, partial [Chloroflexota bacterium]
EEALALYRDRGDKLGVIFATSGLCEVALAVGETRQAHSLAQEKLAVARQLGASDFCVLGLTTVGNVALAEGDDAAARSAYAQGLALLGEPADAWIAVGCLEGFARVAAARNQADRALRLAGQAAAIRAANAIRIPFLDVERVGIGTVSLDRVRLDRALGPIRADAGGLSPEDQAKAWAKGQAMTLEQAIAYALEDEVG